MPPRSRGRRGYAYFRRVWAPAVREGDLSHVFIQLKEVSVTGSRTKASLMVNKLMKSGAVKEKRITVRPGDNLGERTSLPDYDSFGIEEINPGSQIVYFSNGIELQGGESRGANKEAVFEAQIRYTVEEHFRKQARLRDLGIKVLSLFFVDKVDNYIAPDGIVRRAFTDAFEELKLEHADWGGLTADEVQAAYFAFIRRREV